jgi:hypothetical protein
MLLGDIQLVGVGWEDASSVYYYLITADPASDNSWVHHLQCVASNLYAGAALLSEQVSMHAGSSAQVGMRLTVIPLDVNSGDELSLWLHNVAWCCC